VFERLGCFFEMLQQKAVSGVSERDLTILQFQNEFNYYKQKCELQRDDEDMRNTCLWFQERLDMALLSKDNSSCEERIPYGPEGEKDKFIPCRAVIPYGPARTNNSRGRHKILFFGDPNSGIEKIFEYCDQLSAPKPLYDLADWTVKSWEIQTVSLIFFSCYGRNIAYAKALDNMFLSLYRRISICNRFEEIFTN